MTEVAGNGLRVCDSLQCQHKNEMLERATTDNTE